MAYKLLGEMITGAVTNSIVPQTDGSGSTLVHITVTSAQDVIQTRDGVIIGRIHMVANSSIDLSDGLIDDLAKMINRQKLSYQLWEEKIPLSKHLLNYLKKNNKMILGEQAAFKLLHLKPFLELLEGKK